MDQQMKHLLVVLISLFAIKVFASVHKVTMKSITYEPKMIEIKEGDAVQWANDSLTEHSATSFENETQESKFDTGLIQPKRTSKKIEFKKAGNFPYHCSVHGKTMSGKIRVSN